MPGLTTHTYVFYKALSTYPHSLPVFGRIMESHAKALEYTKKNEYSQLKKDSTCVLVGAGYIGACGPDLWYIEDTSKGQFIADLMHYNKPGLFVIWCLREIKRRLVGVTEGDRPDLDRQIAYFLGHISHIAADITTHPYVNSIVGAYPDNQRLFEDARGPVTRNSWRFHNILEQYQDAFVLHNLFRANEGFGEDWQNVNIASAGAGHFIKNKDEFFLLKAARGFYRFARDYSPDLEEWKYNFFVEKNWLIDIDVYYQYSIPSKEMMEACPQLVQRELFMSYVDRSVAQTTSFWREVESYLTAAQTDFTDPQLVPEKRHFRTLRRHWNLDTGLALWGDASIEEWKIQGGPEARVKVAGRLGYETVHDESINDVKITASHDAKS